MDSALFLLVLIAFFGRVEVRFAQVAQLLKSMGYVFDNHCILQTNIYQRESFMNIGQQISTTMNEIDVTAVITNISPAFVSAEIINPPAEWATSTNVAWRLDQYTQAVNDGGIIEGVAST